MSDSLQFVIDQMTTAGVGGLQASDLVTDGSIQRFRPDWERVKSKKRAWYVLYPFNRDDGSLVYSGSFGWFKGSDSYQFAVVLKADAVTLSKSELHRLDQAAVEKRKLVEQLRQSEAEKTRAEALQKFNAFNIEGHSKYAQRKQIATLGVRFCRGSLVLPVMDFDGVLHGLQYIYENGDKRFMTGTAKTGHFCLIGKITDPAGLIGVAEGYATAVSCHMAVDCPVLVAFDAGNLLPVAQALRARYPAAKIVIFGDDDIDNPSNPGREKALAAARAVCGRAVFPLIKEVE